MQLGLLHVLKPSADVKQESWLGQCRLYILFHAHKADGPEHAISLICLVGR